ncbi:MAG: UDP-N-acetylmuramoyl-L-alanyl-D-glutamate--2,6-diaminopimelate ligase, partial [Saprospiraceae bacterium]|nr:UDP-N-acetylmuramoyl-L-alanyl-D-glutamate--2,6-diaminopimelate ligase [Saprospiraceae bacterium]
DGTSVDGHQFIEQVVASGASTIVVSKPVKISAEITVIETKNNRESAALIASNFYDHPSRKLQLVGITGTNGKTSIAFLLHQLFTNLGYRTGLISTINVQIGTHEKLSSLTTPDAISFHSLLAEMAQAGCSFVFMEVSSHALHQSRVAGAKFRLGIFSNITHDHLDYHGSFAEYIKVKKSFFDGLDKDATALVNLDDRNGKIMLQNTSAEQKTYALQNAADYKGKVIANDRTGLQLLVDDTEIFTRLIGIFNAQNLLAVYGAAVILGQEKFEILKSISELQAPPGRFEVFQDIDNRVTALVDYAHTPDALKKALEAILDIKKPQDQVITVVGCGGNRDTSKRPKMAAIACRYSNQVVLTSDNPRDEEPAAIISDMQMGIPEDQRDQVLSIPNRAEAIRTACLLGREQAIILVAGKGHETYQEVRGEKIPFDDREIVKECLN